MKHLKRHGLYWRPIGSPAWAFQTTHYWTPKIQDGYRHVTYIFRYLVELMLSSRPNWHVTLRLTLHSVEFSRYLRSNDFLEAQKPTLSPYLSASLYFSKRGAYWDRLCRDVVGRWLVVTRVHCGQTVHPRPMLPSELKLAALTLDHFCSRLKTVLFIRSYYAWAQPFIIVFIKPAWYINAVTLTLTIVTMEH